MQSANTPLRQRQRDLSPVTSVASTKRSRAAGVTISSAGSTLRRQEALSVTEIHTSRETVRPKDKQCPPKFLAVLALALCVLAVVSVSALLPGDSRPHNHPETNAGIHVTDDNHAIDIETAASAMVTSVLATDAQITSPPNIQLSKLLLSVVSNRGPIRSAALDVLAGIAPEISHGKDDLQSFLLASAKADNIHRFKSEGDDGNQELRDLALKVADSAKRWPAVLLEQTKLLIAKSMQAAEACGAGGDSVVGNEGIHRAASVKFVVDPTFTSPAASINPSFIHRAFIQIWSMIGLHGERVARYRSRPADVVVDSKSASVPGDCLALRANATVALRVAETDGSTSSALVSHVVIEQLPRGQMMQRPRSAPRRFTIYGDVMPASAGASVNAPGWEFGANGSATATVQGHRDSSHESPYSMTLGSFEYLMAAPAAQAFRLVRPAAVQGLRFSFEGVGWGSSYMCIYRLRAYGGPPPACTEVVNPILPAPW